MTDIVRFPGITRLPTDPDVVLESAQGRLELAVVIGVTPEGNFYFESSEPDGGVVVWWLERAKHKLMKIVDEMEEGSS
jgi:hypothetical protein